MEIKKNGEVEVCSEEEGFADAWFRGILEENPTKSGRKKLRVRYFTLLAEDGSSPLIEKIEPKFIRPVPPENEYKDLVLEEGSLVDANYNDGWWTGVIIKKLENDKFWVYYDSPPDIIEFQRNQLRPHLRWTGYKWSQADIQELDKSMYSSGTMVEVSTVINNAETAWFPAMIVKEIEGDDETRFIVKDCTKAFCFNGDAARTNFAVDSDRVRPTPPDFPGEVYKLLDRVEAFDGSAWRQGLVMKILSQNLYLVSLGTTKQESNFKHSELRPCKVWEDGVWLNVSKSKFQENPVKETLKTKMLSSCSSDKSVTPQRITKLTITRSLNFEENEETSTDDETGAATRELRTKRTNDVTNSQVKPTAAEKPATPVQQTEADTQGKTSPKKTLEPMRKKNSTPQKMLEENNSEDSGRKRKREEDNSGLKETDESCIDKIAEINDTINNICTDVDMDDQPLAAWINSLTEQSADHSPIVVKNAAVVTNVGETQGEDTLMLLPFTKTLPLWERFETQELCKTAPQNPHFRPLLDEKEETRESRAVGLMLTFYALLEEVKNLQLDVSSSTLSSFDLPFAELEKHGFDVATAQSRINHLRSLQDGRANKETERKCLEKKIEAEEIEGHKREEEMMELKRKILQLEREQEVAKEKKEAADKRKIELTAYAETIEQEIEDLKLEFETTASAPW